MIDTNVRKILDDENISHMIHLKFEPERAANDENGTTDIRHSLSGKLCQETCQETAYDTADQHHERVVGYALLLQR